MEFRIADTFTDSLARLPAPEQKAVKTSAFDLQTNPENPGLQLHRIDNSKDRNFWSVRVNRDIRIIVHKTEASMLLAYVDHHHKAYAWAERRRIEAHPKTGAVQIVEVRERVEELPLFAPRAPAAAPAPFARLSDEELLSMGAPADWLGDIRAASEDSFLEIAPRLPAEAAEALLQFATTGLLARPAPVPADPYAHPDALRRFRIVENVEELAQALDYSWDKWAIWLHPSQRDLVDKDFSGPARVAGSAGTGKTVVALHRAARLANASPDARVLLATFSDPLAAALERKMGLLVGAELRAPRMRVASLSAIAAELFELAFARRAHIAQEDQIVRALEKAADGAEGRVNLNFLRSEWTHVVDAWQVGDAAAYLAVPRLGRKNRLGSKQRERLWPIFAAARAESRVARVLYLARRLRRANPALCQKGREALHSCRRGRGSGFGRAGTTVFGRCGTGGAEWAVLRRRPRPAHLPAAILLGSARRRRARALRDAEGQLPHVSPNPPRGGPANAQPRTRRGRRGGGAQGNRLDLQRAGAAHPHRQGSSRRSRGRSHLHCASVGGRRRALRNRRLRPHAERIATSEGGGERRRARGDRTYRER